MPEPVTLFGHDLPAGFHYRENFITADEEQALLGAVADITFSEFEMRGVVARRRVAFFGESYDGTVARPLPAFLFPCRARIARWAGVDAEAFAMALINEYRPGTPIGWHRDAPQYRCHRRHLAIVGLPDEASPLPFSCRAEGISSRRDTRDRPRAPIRVPDDAGSAHRV